MDSRRSVPLADIDDVVLNTPSSWWDIPVGGGFSGRAWAARLAKSFDDANPLSVENGRHQMVRLVMETDLPEVPDFGPADAHLMHIAERMTVLF
ncbi:MAG: hypothetical protein ACQEW8_02395 [Actinomycetota bacterium]